MIKSHLKGTPFVDPTWEGLIWLEVISLFPQDEVPTKNLYYRNQDMVQVHKAKMKVVKQKNRSSTINISCKLCVDDVNISFRLFPQAQPWYTTDSYTRFLLPLWLRLVPLWPEVYKLSSIPEITSSWRANKSPYSISNWILGSQLTVIFNKNTN